MKRSCTITVFTVLMLCIISSPCAAETINPYSTTLNPIYQLVSTTPTPPTAGALGRGITRVDVSIDGGKSWHDASLHSVQQVGRREG